VQCVVVRGSVLQFVRSASGASLLQSIAECCSVQCAAVRDSLLQSVRSDVYPVMQSDAEYCSVSVLQCVAVCCSASQCIAVCCSVLQCVAVCCSVLQCVAVCCSVLWYVAVCNSVLRCVAVCCIVLQCARSDKHRVPGSVFWGGNDGKACTLQHIATHCNTLQHTATHCNTLQHCNTLYHSASPDVHRVIQSVAVCCSALQSVAVCSVLHCAVVCCSALQCVAACFSVLQCVGVCCSVLQSGQGRSYKVATMSRLPNLSSFFRKRALLLKGSFAKKSRYVRSLLIAATPQNIETHCNDLKHTAIMQHTETHCNAFREPTRRCHPIAEMDPAGKTNMSR